MNAAAMVTPNMHYVRRLLHWAIFLGCVTALGACVFFFVHHRPRCTIEGPLETVHLSSDGSRLVTRNTMPNHDKHIPKVPGWTVHYGPLQDMFVMVWHRIARHQ